MKPLTSLILTGILSLIFLGPRSLADESIGTESLEQFNHKIIR